MIPPRLAPPPSGTITDIRAEILAGRRSCRDVLDACLARIDEAEPSLRAWVVVDRDGARAQARRLDEGRAAGEPAGPLHGIPVGIKDIIDVAGLPTACGSPLGAEGVAAADAPVVARLRAAGAVVVGKTVTTAYAWIDPPPTRNPWDPSRTPGGSSSGSAAATAAGMIPGALGSQTGGSITRPAAYCGVAGLKPTYGRLPCAGIMPLAPSLDHPGPIARTVADLAALWGPLAGSDPRDRPGRPGGAPIRLGLPRGYFADRIEPSMAAGLATAVDAWRAAGIAVVPVDLPGGFTDAPLVHRRIRAAEAASWHGPRLAARPDAYPPRIRALVEEGLALPAVAYDAARLGQEALRAVILGTFEGVDALVTPAALGPAPDASTTGDPLLNAPWSLTGLPTVSFPIGPSAPEGLPLAAQLVGRPHDEAALLALGIRLDALLTGRDPGSSPVDAARL